VALLSMILILTGAIILFWGATSHRAYDNFTVIIAMILILLGVTTAFFGLWA
jgi:hypothetical protein